MIKTVIMKSGNWKLGTCVDKCRRYEMEIDGSRSSNCIYGQAIVQSTDFQCTASAHGMARTVYACAVTVVLMKVMMMNAEQAE